MKMKKKVIAILIVIALVLLANNILAMSELVAQARPSTDELKGEQEVTITFSFDRYQQIKKGVNAFKAKLEYNKEIFEEVKQSDFQCLNDWEKLQYNQETGEQMQRVTSKVTEWLCETAKKKHGWGEAAVSGNQCILTASFKS